MTKDEMAKLMDHMFGELVALRTAGQAEYAHAEKNAFANFERVAERLGLDRKEVLMVYAEKHLDGIHSFIKGHKSQREDVRGRINDVIVYMCLLRGMIEEEQKMLDAKSEEGWQRFDKPMTLIPMPPPMPAQDRPF